MISLLPELLLFSDVKPVPMQGGGREQPWIMPIYGQSAELEMMDFLYAFVRLLKPGLIAEAGCHMGLGAYALGRAAQDNGSGEVFTCDVEPNFVSLTTARCAGLPVTVKLCSAEEMDEIGQADFVFLDSSYETRISCLDRVRPGAVVVIHDTRQSPELRPAVELHPNLHFQTWRGFSIAMPL